ncbi:MAG: helix-turn-helix transcriptional regulator [Anaerovoracaceae bacterium]
MAKGSNQKLKLVYLMKILMENTDENHSITMPEIINALGAYGISAERKSVYDDIEMLKQYGMDIIGEKINKAYCYRVVSRDFELAELKLLVDSVQSSKFITVSKSRELIKKIEGLASKYEASQLHRQVFVAERVKTMNESIYYNVDMIHSAISSNSQITFQYFKWNEKGETVLKKEGALYEVSPWALSWDDENYYLIAYDSAEHKIKHFRVDKMLRIEMNGKNREGKESFAKLDMGIYAKKTFGMFGGDEVTVRLECNNELAGVIIDRFGKDKIFTKVDDEHFAVNVDVFASRQFLAWVIGLGEGIRITGPDFVVQQMKQEAERLMRQYRDE